MRTAIQGRPKKHEEIVWFGMKLSPKDKADIKRLATQRGIPASALVIELVKKEMDALSKTTMPTATSLRRLRKDARSAYLVDATRKAVTALEAHDLELIEDVPDLLEY